ncbi:hypothetical protein C8R44DRAFT_753324 [Mycena epipterygia]|nr:hypothetical protein C8R44DRAFT_753324 [Mycena epipterygia]
MVAQYSEKALSLAQICGDSRKHRIALRLKALLKYKIGDYHAGQMHACEAQKLGHLSTDLYEEAKALITETACLRALGNLKESIFSCQRARELIQLCGMEGSLGDCDAMNHLAEVHLHKSEYFEARNIHVELAQKRVAQQDPIFHAYALFNITEVDVMIGADTLEVEQSLNSMKTKFGALRQQKLVNQCETILAELHLQEGNALAAEDLLRQCLLTAWGKDFEAVSYCLERLADVSRWTSHMDWPSAWTMIFLAHAQKTREKLALHKALRFLGDVFLSEGDAHTAHNLFVIALEGFTYMDVHRSRADCMFRLGDIAQHRGDWVKAVDLWNKARPLFERSLQAKNVAQIDTRLASIDKAMDISKNKIAPLNKLETPTTILDEVSIAKDAVSESHERIAVQY